MRLLSKAEIEKGNFMPTSIARAKRLIVKEVYRTVKHVVFRVIDPVSGSEHEVFYKSEKKPPLDWVCDCRWYSSKTVINGSYCAHILAVHLSRLH